MTIVNGLGLDPGDPGYDLLGDGGIGLVENRDGNMGTISFHSSGFCECTNP
jgi:hypothetical protein